ncbi:MAG: polysaccharide deacetylase family protein [Anaerolineae bacterium]|nr:polysaccharide deacetylase family protein [Anaerolineae bacterium]
MRILMYHSIVAGAPEDVHDVSLAAFSAHMAWLGGQEIPVVDLQQAVLEGGLSDGAAVAITFDDGYEDNYSRAWPVLQRYGFPATVFLATDHVGKTSRWREGALGATSLLAWDQIKALEEAGWRFASHTASHVALTRLPLSEVEVELLRSKAALAEALGHEITGICYPFSQVNPHITALAQRLGYTWGATYRPGYVGDAGPDPWLLQRIGILATDTRETFAAKVRGSLLLRVKWIRRQVRQSVRRLIGRA